MQYKQPPKSKNTFINLPHVRWHSSVFLKLLIAFGGLSIVTTLLVFTITVVVWELEYTSSQIRLTFILTGVVTVLLSSLFTFVIIRAINQPMRTLRQAMEKIAEGDMNVKVTIQQGDEFGSLAILFNSMVQQLRETQERNVSIAQLKSQFVSVAAHQLRTPLTGLKWTMRYLLDGDGGRITKKQKQVLQQAFAGAEGMMHLVNELLDVSKVEEGRFGYTFMPVDIVDVVNKVVSAFLLPAQNRQVTLDFKYDKNNPQYQIVADPNHLRLAVANLFDNAIRYSQSGGVVTIRLAAKGTTNLEMSIHDDGIGIPKSEQDKVFQRFFRAGNAVRTQTTGSGLGLFITRNIVERHGGQIWFESTEGKGTTFFITLPFAST